MGQFPIFTNWMERKPPEPKPEFTLVEPVADDERFAGSGISRRPWGSFESIGRGHNYQVKRIEVKPGGRLSLQFHHCRSEHWTIVNGRAHVTLGEVTSVMTENESLYIPLGAVHRIENRGKDPVVLVEVQYGSYLGEDDIVRLVDVYGRA